MSEGPQYSNLLDFIIIHLDEKLMLELLSDPDTCRTFVRLLSPLAQHILFRLLMLSGPWPLSRIREWSSYGSEHEHQQAFRQLRDSNLLSIKITAGHEADVELIPTFKNMLLRGTATSVAPPPRSDRKPLLAVSGGLFETKPKFDFADPNSIPYVTEEVLDKWAISQHDKILEWMLGLTTTIDPDIRQLLVDSHLIQMDDNLTRDGNQFVLADRRSQIWRIVRSYLESFRSDSAQNMISALRFLLKLGSLQFTRGHAIDTLSEVQQSLLKPFRSLGLLHFGHAGLASGFYFPTRVVLNFFGRSELFASEGWILIDTNFKITAYVKTRLQVALLRRFSLITYEMPGFTSAYISPDSFKKALDGGTSLADILGFLRANLSALGDHKIPSNVEHQFYIWQKQRDRILTTPNCVLRTYSTEEQAVQAAELARMMYGFLAIFHDDLSHTVITTEGIEDEYKMRLRGSFA
jgi:transcription initiation factor TFIIH subunit 4